MVIHVENLFILNVTLLRVIEFPKSQIPVSCLVFFEFGIINSNVCNIQIGLYYITLYSNCISKIVLKHMLLSLISPQAQLTYVIPYFQQTVIFCQISSVTIAFTPS